MKGTSLKRSYAKISLRPQEIKESLKIAGASGLSLVTSRVLSARGFIVSERLSQFLSPSLQDGLLPPQSLKNLDEACKRIAQAIEREEIIAITNDFDVDGLSGGAQLCAFLSSVGAKIISFVPDRFTDGYGLNKRIIDDAVSNNASLIITVDFGTKNKIELDYARSKGLCSIVIDHHHMGMEECDADIFINPHQKECGFAEGTLSAAGLCWYLIIGLRKQLTQALEVKARDFLDLACLGTVCDMVPLVGVNRVIAKRGLELLTHTKRPGLIALKEVLGITKEVRCHDIGFGFGPRINAAGRLINGSVVIELLTTNCAITARRIAKQLHDLNDERQKVEKRVKECADKFIKSGNILPWGIVVWGADYHTGVIGIVAQRLTEEYYRPAAVLGADGEGVFKGSVRSIPGISVVSLLEKLEPLLIKYGGHEGAGGFAIEAKNIDKFQSEFNLECIRQAENFEVFIPSVVADTQVKCVEITMSLVEELPKLGPFGVGNKSPVLVARDVVVTDVTELKGGHTKVVVRDDSGALSGVCWRTKDHPALRKGKKIDIAFKPDKNSFQGNTTIQANIIAAQEL